MEGGEAGLKVGLRGLEVWGGVKCGIRYVKDKEVKDYEKAYLD